MEKDEYTLEQRRATERFVLFVFSIYALGTCAVYFNRANSLYTYVNFYLILAIVVSWVIFLGNVRDYLFRATFLTRSIYIAIFLYWILADSFEDCFVAFLTFMILTAIYGIPNLVFPGTISMSAALVVHIFIAHGFGSGSSSIAHTITQIIALYISQYVFYFMLSRQQETTEHMQETLDQLKEAQTPRKRFLSNVSHEIRTPINSICGMTDVVLREDLPPQVREDLSGIHAAGQTLLSIVSNALDYMDLESGNVSARGDVYGINSTINDLLVTVLPKIEQKNLELLIDVDGNIPAKLIGDELKIRRVLTCLLDNAAKYTDNGYIRLSIKGRKEEYGTNLTFCVEDTGCGMSPEMMETIISQTNGGAGTAANVKQEGMGIGLAISRSLVDVMGGFLSIDSKEGVGTRVTFVIPQKVLNYDPMVKLNHPERVHGIAYLHLEKNADPIKRAAIAENLTDLTKSLNVDNHICQTLAEMKRRISKETYTHVFVTYGEYEEDPMYFDLISQSIHVVVICSRKEAEHIVNRRISVVLKPFYIGTMASVLNGEARPEILSASSRTRFTAPDVKVLAVDDNAMNLKVVEGLLRPYLIQVETASSGAEAIRKVESMDYDFIFMDHMMPEMDGVEALHRIRQIPGNYFRDVPIIALTANAIAGTREMFMSEGFNDFMSKPIDLSTMERILRKYIREEKMQEASKPLVMLNSNREQTRTMAAKATEKPERRENLKSSKKSYPQLGFLSRNQVDKEELQKRFPEMNVAEAMKNCAGDIDMLLDIVQVYYETSEEILTKISEALNEKVWQNYAIHLHGLKSTSATIGLMELSSGAKSLEMAAKLEDEDFIMKHHEDTILMFENAIRMIEASGLVEKGNADAE